MLEGKMKALEESKDVFARKNMDLSRMLQEKEQLLHNQFLELEDANAK